MNLNQRVPGELNWFKVQKDQEGLRQNRRFNSSGVILRGGRDLKKRSISHL